MQSNSTRTTSTQKLHSNTWGNGRPKNLGFRVRLIISIFTPLLVLDQFSKYIARHILGPLPPHSYLNDLFRLEYSENKGAFLSLGSTLPEGTRFLLFTVLIGLVIGYLIFYILHTASLNRSQLLALIFLSGGGLSNWIDRIVFKGHVIDFLNVGIGPLRTGIFNIADMFQMAGIAIVLLNMTKHPRKNDTE